MSYKTILFILLLLGGIGGLGAAAFLITKTAHNPKPEKAVPSILFTNKNASLSLEKETGRQGWKTILTVSIPECTGSLASAENGAASAVSTLESGTLSNGMLKIDQPPTMGEAACIIELKIKANEVVAATQVKGDCDAWHGKTCPFSTEILGGMKRVP